MGQAARKVTVRDANAKLAHRRLTVLELAERLGNVAEACRRGGIDRTSFYDWKRRFQLEGLDGLKDLPPIAKSHPMTTPVEVVARIEALALLHPAYGCNRLAALLALEGRRLSAITIQKILNDKGLGTRHERWLALERTNADQAIELTPEQAAFLEKLNPCFRERHVESGRPGELLSADTFMVGTLKGIGRVYLHAVVDTFGSYAFGFLHVSKQPEAAVAVLHNDVLPFYARLDLPIGAVLTDNGREFCGTERHAYELYLALNDIEHRKTRVGSPRTNGFVERFNGTVLEEFFRPTMRSRLYESVAALQADLDACCTTTTTAAAPRLPQPGPPPMGHRRAVRQPVIRKTRRLRRHVNRLSLTMRNALARLSKHSRVGSEVDTRSTPFNHHSRQDASLAT
jgi:transposase InsO family protein